MKVEFHITDEIAEEMILAALRQDLKNQKDWDPRHPGDKKNRKQLIKALKRVIKYYGG